jgi:hypothetical protein
VDHSPQVAAEAIVEDGAWLADLRRELFALLAGVFAQVRSRLTAFAYVGALLAEPRFAGRVGSWPSGLGMPRLALST